MLKVDGKKEQVELTTVIDLAKPGMIVAEQLARLGFGEVILIDHDRMARKNLNRILDSTVDDVDKQRLKVDVIGEAIQSCRSHVSVKTAPTGIGCVESRFQFGGGAEPGLIDDLADAAIEAFHHAVGLRRAWWNEAMLELELRAQSVEQMLPAGHFLLALAGEAASPFVTVASLSTCIR